MPFQDGQIRAVIFDYGNTLVEFTAAKLHACDAALARTLHDLFGEVDTARLRTIRNHDRRAPYSGDLRESDLADISTDLVRQLYGRAPTPDELARILQVRYDSFVENVEAPEYLMDFLDQLSGRYVLGLLSNYPDGDAIRATLKQLELTHFFDAVVVSGDVGRVKPHALPFETILEALDVAAGEAVYVGDNWFGDIQGAKRAGMRAVYTVQYDTPEKFDRQPGDHDADLTISHLTELLEVL